MNKRVVDPHEDDRWHEIEILLHEYDTLRAESLHRNIILYTVSAATAATDISIIGNIIQSKLHFSYIILLFAISGLFMTWFLLTQVHSPLAKITARLRDLELIINKLARKKLLTWERCNGFGGLIDLQGEVARDAAKKAVF